MSLSVSRIGLLAFLNPGQAQAYWGRCVEIVKEPGCEQFEVFQSVVNPDKLALLERWTDKRRWTRTRN